MSQNKKINTIGAVAILVGTCIGAGIFGLPYVIAKVGLAIGISYMVVLGFISLITTLAYGEVVLRTKGVHQFPEYTRRYLGKKWETVAVLVIIVGFYGALIAYFTESTFFLHSLISPSLGGGLIYYRLIYFFFLLIIIYFGLKIIAKLEKIMMFVILFIIFLLLIFGVPKIEVSNLLTHNLNNLLLPYGVILFAFAAASAVPDMKNVLTENKSKLKKAVIWGMIVPLIIYIIFAVVVVGISGVNTTESAVDGLASVLGPVALIMGAIFGIITMTTSFLALALVLREMYQYDFKINKILSCVLVAFPPLIIVFLNLATFIEIIGVTGALIGGVNGIIMIHMYEVARKKGERKPEYELSLPSYFIYIVYAVFTGGIIYEAYMVFNKFFN